MVLSVTIPGEPVGKGRPRVTMAGSFARAYTPAKTRTWSAAAARLIGSAHHGPPVQGPVRVEVVAVKARPKAMLRRCDPDGQLWRVAKPDGDNVLKSVLDAVTSAGFWLDDTQAVDCSVLSVYAERGGQPRVEVRLILIGGTGPTPCGPALSGQE